MSKSEGHGSLFQLQGNDMSKKISLKMIFKFAASLNLGETIMLSFVNK